jgi:hypothetical protein
MDNRIRFTKYQMNNTPTPETDAQGFGDGRHPWVATSFARKLERERDEARRENEQLKRYAHYCRPQSGSNHKLRSNIDRTDLPSDVIDDIRYAYGEIMRIYKLLDDQTESTQKALQKRDDD